MKIFDCSMYYDEDLLLDLRLNFLDQYVDKFVIVEAEYTHQGKKREQKFNIKKFSNFSKKIIYKLIKEFPNNLTPSQRDNFHRNFISNCLGEADLEDLIIISDADEIPNLKNFKYNSFYKYYFFEQNFFCYKLNLLNKTNPTWYGSRACKKKFLKNPQWFRNLKPRREIDSAYPIWRIDKIRYKYIKNGGWHFSFLKSASGIKNKLESYAHSEFNKENFTNLKNIELHLSANTDVLKRDISFEKIDIDINYPDYITNNINKFHSWILK